MISFGRKAATLLFLGLGIKAAFHSTSDTPLPVQNLPTNRNCSNEHTSSAQLALPRLFPEEISLEFPPPLQLSVPSQIAHDESAVPQNDEFPSSTDHADRPQQEIAAEPPVPALAAEIDQLPVPDSGVTVAAFEVSQEPRVKYAAGHEEWVPVRETPQPAQLQQCAAVEESNSSADISGAVDSPPDNAPLPASLPSLEVAGEASERSGNDQPEMPPLPPLAFQDGAKPFELPPLPLQENAGVPPDPETVAQSPTAEDQRPDNETKESRFQSRTPDRLKILNKSLAGIVIQSNATKAEPFDRARDVAEKETPILVRPEGWFDPRPDRYPVPMYYQPLYFEDQNLERCGNGHGICQPLCSAGQFLGEAFLLPFAVAAVPPKTIVQSPGDCPSGCRMPSIPDYKLTPIQIAKGSAVQAVAIVGAIFLML